MLIPSSKLKYSAAEKTFSAFASDLLPVGAVPRSVELRSAKTGMIKNFNYVGPTTDCEGDIRCFDFISECGLYAITLIND